jgi:phenylalanyl-tRNA synthetase beta chain
MKVSLNWLNKLVKVDDLDPKELADKLTFAGVEVESVNTLASATNLVIGKILSCEKHPDSDHLHVLQVDEGKKYGIHQIVCGAPNARTGLKVIVAREGAVLPQVTIEKSEIRGIESDGMCCALYELGVDKKYLSLKQTSGIEELSEDAPVGEENVLGYLGLDDTILDLDLLANRSDLNAIENVALEVGTLENRDVILEKTPSLKEVSLSLEVGSVSEKCPLFKAKVVKDVLSKPSPKWLSGYLTSSGVRSIDNIVDIGNYIMLLTGQPLNMYDYDKLPKKELVVRDDYEGDFLAMDDKVYHLQKGDLVVTSAGQVMCLGGIMTSKACAVDDKTKNVVIEVANFAGASIRHTSNRLGLVSESSSRFVKGINPNQSERVLALSAQELLDLADAKEVSTTISFDTLKHEKHVINCSTQYINARLGTSFAENEIVDVLKRDHLDVKENGGGALEIGIPSSRIDIAGGADISEEVIRLLGYDKVISRLPKGGAVYQGLSEEQKDKIAIRRYLREQGLDEVLTYTLVDKKLVNQFHYIGDEASYCLANPMTDDHQYVRTNILPSLLKVASYNVSRQTKDLAIFETSNINSPKENRLHLAMVLVGEETLGSPLKKRNYDFYSVKGLLDGILGLLTLNEKRFKFVPLVSNKDEFHPGRSASLLIGNKVVGVLGELHPSMLKEYDLGKSAVALELDLGAILELKTSPIKALQPSKYPFVSRDLAFVIKDDISYEEIRREISRTDKLIKNVEIFDLYQGDNIAKGFKSVALTISFMSEEKTLKDEEVNAVMEKIVSTLKIRFLAEVRQ